MLIRELKNREVRARLSILSGLVLGVFYVTANILLCIFYSAVWYLSLALYNACLMLCRYYSLELFRDGRVADKISYTLTLASVLMSLAILYSSVSGEYKIRSLPAIIISGIYTVFSLLRLVISVAGIRERTKTIYSVIDRLRVLSFLTSSHAFILQIVNVTHLEPLNKTLLTFFSAFFSSLFMLSYVPVLKNRKY